MLFCFLFWILILILLFSCFFQCCLQSAQALSRGLFGETDFLSVPVHGAPADMLEGWRDCPQTRELRESVLASPAWKRLQAQQLFARAKLRLFEKAYVLFSVFGFWFLVFGFWFFVFCFLVWFLFVLIFAHFVIILGQLQRKSWDWIP